MERAIIIRGTLSDPKHIELEEAVHDIKGSVEVTVRAAVNTNKETTPRQGIVEFIASLGPGTRPKEEIDAQLAEERGSWGNR